MKNNSSRRSHLKKVYGLTPLDVETMLEDQEYRCCICDKQTAGIGRGKQYLNIDHHHISGKIRGLLCSGCNKGLGYFNEDTQALQKAIEYLRRDI
jgi:hypothetical protein